MILHIPPYFLPETHFGGPPRKIHQLCRASQAAGVSVRVFTVHSKHPAAPADVDVLGVPVSYSSWLGRGNWKVPLSLRKLSRFIQQADVVHLYGLYSLLVPWAAQLAQRLAKPYVIEPLGMYTPRVRSQRWKLFYHRIFTQPLFARAAQVIATSQVEYQELAPLVPAARLTLRANGVDIDAFANLPDPAHLRQRWGLTAHERVVLFVGRIHPIKNLETLVQAFAQARLKSKLLLVGPLELPAYAVQLRQLIHSLGLTEQVLLTDALYDDDLKAVLALASFVVLPSQYESFGNAAAEAVAAGIPVLVTTGCGIAPIVDHRAGLVVEPTISGLALGLQNMTETGARYAQTLPDVQHELSWQRPTTQLIQLYRSLAPT